MLQDLAEPQLQQYVQQPLMDSGHDVNASEPQASTSPLPGIVLSALLILCDLVLQTTL